jgi:isatin hydrolase
MRHYVAPANVIDCSAQSAADNDFLLTADGVRTWEAEHGVIGWGTQCIGTDAGRAGGMQPPFPVHNLLRKANRYGLASLCNLDKLPPKGAILLAAPLKIVKGTGSPVRALALVPKV